MWPTGEYVTPEDVRLRSVGVQRASGKERRSSSKKSEEAGPTWKCDQLWMRQVVKVKSKQYCIETWNVRSVNQGELDVVKQEMASVNINILESMNLKGWEWESLIQMTIEYTTVGKNPLKEME